MEKAVTRLEKRVLILCITSLIPTPRPGPGVCVGVGNRIKKVYL